MLDRTGGNNDTTKRSDRPVPIGFNLGKCALTIRNNCGECMHFKRMAYPAYIKPCFELGIIEEQKPCPVFAINPERIKFSENKHVRNIARAMKEMSPRELKNLASLINQEERSRRNKFRLGQAVVFRAFGGDYVSNYVKATVLWANSEYVHVEGTKGCVATLFHSSVMTEKAWNKKELQLLKENKQIDPAIHKYTKVPTKAEKNIKSLIDKTLNTLSSETKTTATLSSTKAPRKSERYTELTELLSLSTR